MNKTQLLLGATGQVRLPLPEHPFKELLWNPSGVAISPSGGLSNRFLSFPELTVIYMHANSHHTCHFHAFEDLKTLINASIGSLQLVSVLGDINN